MGPKQQILLQHLHEGDGELTKKRAVSLIGNFYYCNASKHVGDVLTRMVKSGLLRRVKRGHYAIGNGYKKEPIPENQTSIFENTSHD